MRKSWAEYKRAARERERDRWTAQERELNTSVFRRPFSEFSVTEHRSGFGSHYLILGRKWWDFSQDDGIEPLDADELDEDDKDAAFNSLGKAELVLSVLEDVIETLSRDIADYKRSEIEARINEIPKSHLRDSNAKASMDELERLKKMRHNLNKRVRRTLPQTRAAGR
ncbi:hypothetical protein ELH42_29935 (plasmid) [Rhizobium ruizarguesonis]|uniref:hypothetical protein n=1 Tax=Rhizobium ruizarguesonis TaxID=2081791 RepID=UPI0010315657|nr:hypothetical protein [Rhizobium ruizarguesonis]NEJ14185.1 hypothetical protein [Rhizobium ruizarguesonis]NEK28557.1 hypothetical protein [Rhizobium ruizarguesonis]TBB60058.1 hypothetical protein ELH42_29935 [Rhizobium ruizarguesonis]